MRSETNNRSVAAVVVCAGRGERSGLPYNKVLHRIGRKTVLESVLDVFTALDVSHVTVVASEADYERMREIAASYRDTSVVCGGATRFDSVLAGLKAHECDIVIIHDGARPFVSRETVLRSIESAIKFGSGIAAVPTVDTVKRVGSDGVAHSVPRAELFNVQTPQTFRYSEILSAYAQANGGSFTDDAEVYEHAGYTPRLVDGEYANRKITTPGDLIGVPENCRIGVGFDVHRLVEGRKLILGGVTIEHRLGLLGHSDADVLIHAIMDALLSAADLPDIGVLFPDTDEKYRGISSVKLLQNVTERVAARGFRISSVSAVIMAQQPKLAPVISEIRESLAQTLGIDRSRINVSATTTEGLGIVGNNEGMAASASCILTEICDGRN